MDIFWIHQGRREGPLPVVEIISMLQRGQLDEDAKAWHEGAGDWMPLKELPALAGYFTKKAPVQIEGEDADTAHPASGGDKDTAQSSRPETSDRNVTVLVVPTPGMRFWAKLIDILLVILIGCSAIPLFNLGFNPEYMLAISFLLVPYETVCLRIFGTTLGKYLLNIRVSTITGHPLPWHTSFIRAMYVLVLGLGFIVFPFMPIMPLFSWYWTRRKGLPPWDMRLGITTWVTGRVGFMRIFLYTWIILILLQLIGTCLMPWQQELENQYPPELRKTIAEMMPK